MLNIDQKIEKPAMRQTDEIDFFADNTQGQSSAYTAQFNTNPQKPQEDDFNTMQNFFATMNINQPPPGMIQPQQPQKGTLDLFDEAEKGQSPPQNPQQTNPMAVLGNQLQ